VLCGWYGYVAQPRSSWGPHASEQPAPLAPRAPKWVGVHARGLGPAVNPELVVYPVMVAFAARSRTHDRWMNCNERASERNPTKNMTSNLVIAVDSLSAALFPVQKAHLGSDTHQIAC